MSILRLTVLTTLLLSALGCTLGPDPSRPQTAADEALSFVNASEETAVRAASLSPWWTRFGDRTTVELVEQALAHNTDLRIAAANVLEAEASLRSARSPLWPQLEYGLRGSKSETAFNLPAQGLISVEATTYSTNLGLSYQVDLFGKLKRTRQSAWASFLAQEAAADTVMHTVIAGVVRARVQVATSERALAIARDILQSWERTLQTVERRYRSGLVQAVDLYLARENFSATKATVVQLEATVKHARHALDVLVGRRPGAGPELADTLPDLPSLDPVPLGLPVELLDRRPDLRQSEFQLAAATYGVGAALADLYPNLSLGASYGTTSNSLSDLFDLDRAVYQLIGNLVGPLFEGGARRAEVEAARARLEASAASYAGTVLVALREVEDAIVADAANQEQLEYSEQRLEEARSADRLASDRYQRGVESLLTVLETERRLRSSEEALITIKANTWNTRIDLFLALGGDWSPTEKEDETSTPAPSLAAANPFPESSTNREVF